MGFSIRIDFINGIDKPICKKIDLEMTIIEIITIKKIFPISQFLKSELIFLMLFFGKEFYLLVKLKIIKIKKFEARPGNYPQPQLYLIFGNLFIFILFINFIVVKFKILYLTLN